MTIIGFNFSKIQVERTGTVQGKVKIANNVGVTDVSEAKVNLSGSSNAGLKFSFAFSCNYEPSVGKIVLEGEVITMEEKKTADEIVKSWKDKKHVPENIMASVLNTVLNRCNIQALILSRDMNLPSPIQLPKVNIKKADEKKD